MISCKIFVLVISNDLVMNERFDSDIMKIIVLVTCNDLARNERSIAVSRKLLFWLLVMI
jgi:hypothetical protein